ncbi:hypothetical protein [Rhizobium sp. AG855]|uniref:hypothetical protein n=1 Tax=Rhizobium sp. AG855 TaxID=2183898 RepID=UPI000FF06B56|nr:hypothetical protein [Rhizobium sp. AG855]RKE86381.1 hypothetical protein DFO46_3193 [Rhizobium sp. AG855]
MKVDTAASYMVSGARTTAAMRAETQAFGAMVSARVQDTQETTSGSDGQEALDFTRMTRQELFDWMNEQLRSGKMSFDESAPFLGMTLKISAETGEPVDMATDNSRIDFTEKARQGIEFYQLHFDQASADALQAALEKMLDG